MHELFGFVTNNWLLMISFVLVCVALSINELFAKRMEGEGITPTDAVNFINHNNAVMIDIRSSNAFNATHIIDSINLPLDSLLSDNNILRKKYIKRKLIVVCAVGKSAVNACKMLKKSGYDAQFLLGGLTAWQNANLPVISV